MQNGIYVDDISTPDIKIKQLYIKWNEKIDVSIKDIKITTSKKSDSKLDVDEINNLFNKASLFHHWIERLTIKNISFNEIEGSFNYDEGNGGFLQATSDKFILESSLKFQSDFLIIKIDTLKDIKRSISTNGNIVIDKGLNIAFDLKTDVNNEILLQTTAFTNRDKFLYSVKSDKKIKSIKHLVDSIGLPAGIRYWIIDAIDMKYVTLNKLNGWIDYNDIENAYKNLYASATLTKLNYMYDKKLDTIHTATTDIEFKDGELLIYPRKAYSYGQYLGDSWIKIDFTRPQEILTLHLLFDGILNRDMLGILEHYKIKLPFLQQKGKVAVDLKLDINLHTIAIDTEGKFFVKDGNFDYLGLNLDIQDADIILNNYDVRVNNMKAQYGELASSKVDFTYDAKRSIGKINFDVISIKFDDINLSLADKSLKIEYKIFPNRDKIYVQKSNWKLFNHNIEVDKLILPFDLDTLIINVPKTKVKIDDIAIMQAEGRVALENLSANIDADLTKLSYKNIELAQSIAKLKFVYNKNLKINMPEKTSLLVGSKKSNLSNTAFSLENSIISVESSIEVDKLGHVDTSLKYNLKTEKGATSLSNMDVKNEKFGSMFYREEALDFEISNIDNVLKINSVDIDAYFISTNGIWVTNVGSLDEISKYSKTLQKFKITNGKFNLSRLSKSKYMSYALSTKYPHKVLVIDNLPISELNAYGRVDIESNRVTANINRHIKVEINEKINVLANNVGVDVFELLDALENNETSDKKNDLEISLTAKDCFLYISETRRVISDEINLQYKSSKLTASLKHKDGTSGFSFYKNNFELYGENFNDRFMEELFSLSKFKGGQLSFSMNGTPKEYQGIFNIDDTVIKSYKVINNVLAFVNTIPSLVTFSLPGYHKHGLKVSNAYMNFTSLNDNLKVSNVYLDSKELKILGNGEANFKENSVNMKLNLKTDLGSAVSKVPVVGHILFDDDTISTSLSIKGKLNDPKVKSLIAKDIIVAPLNIIKRTLLYPFHLLSKIQVTGAEDINISEEEE